MTINQSDTTSPSQTAYMSQYCTHKRTHLCISKCTHHYTKICHHAFLSDDYKYTYDDYFTWNCQVPFEQETEREHTSAHLSCTGNCNHYYTNAHCQVHSHIHLRLHPHLHTLTKSTYN
jgi:hypothetical protein